MNLDAPSLAKNLIKEMRGSIDASTILIGIHAGGILIRDFLLQNLQCDSVKASVDVSFHRDDFEIRGLAASKGKTSIPIDISGRDVVLVDDVIQTGRTARAAVNELFDFGRPRSIQLAVLVDRSGRELPLEPRFAGGKIVIEDGAQISVLLNESNQIAIRVA